MDKRRDDQGSDRWSTRKQLVAAAVICVPILAVGSLVLSRQGPAREDLSDVFDRSVRAVSELLGEPIDGPHDDLGDWHESNAGGVNCRMHRHARWELDSNDPNSVIESFERIVNRYGRRHNMMVQPVHDDRVLEGEPRTAFIVMNGYRSWMYGGANDEGQFTLFVESDGC